MIIPLQPPVVVSFNPSLEIIFLRDILSKIFTLEIPQYPSLYLPNKYQFAMFVPTGKNRIVNLMGSTNKI